MKKAAKSTAKILSSHEAFRGPLFRVTIDQVREPGGYTARRDVVRHPGSVVILAVRNTKGGAEILLERQYRHAAGGFLWELPAGKVDFGESELAAAKRELLEETGFRAKSWKAILNFYVSPGFLDERMRVFLARGLKAGEAQPEADERIESRFFSVGEALRMTEQQEIGDAKTIASLFWLALHER
jgi:ADP-ribose pyrophosphatase